MDRIPMRKLTFEIDQRYDIAFRDHVMGEQLLTIVITGHIMKQDAESVTLSSWTVLGCKEFRDANTEPVTIIKSTIVKKRKNSFKL